MSPAPSHAPCIPAWYAEPLARFLAETPATVLGRLAARSPFDITAEQRDAWVQQIVVLAAALADIAGWIFLEFDIPRLGSRIDAVVVTGAAVIPIEFKVGERHYLRDDVNQAWDYALDLKNFHAASHDAAVFPMLVATAAARSDAAWQPAHADGVRPPRCSNQTGLAAAIVDARRAAAGAALDGAEWGRAAYQPTPTIIEAAQALYARHTVEAISRNDAGARNLTVTSRTVEEVIEAAARDAFKAIVFVTGVPGAGKTLVGLSVATRHRRVDEATHAVFLSGNGPLVAVLREALTRDELARRRAGGERVRKGAIAQQVKPFLQNIHHFHLFDGQPRNEPTYAPPRCGERHFDAIGVPFDVVLSADEV